jgi:hypothetical protein
LVILALGVAVSMTVLAGIVAGLWSLTAQALFGEKISAT